MQHDRVLRDAAQHECAQLTLFRRTANACPGSLAPLSGTPVKPRIVIQQTDLFALQFVS